MTVPGSVRRDQFEIHDLQSPEFSQALVNLSDRSSKPLGRPLLTTESNSARTLNMALTKDDVYAALKDVYDPEIPVNVVDLGLIYNVEVEDGDVHVEMTLTAQGCGMGPYIAQQAEWRVAELDDVEDVQVDVVFDPPWNPEMITEDGKRLLGID